MRNLNSLAGSFILVIIAIVILGFAVAEVRDREELAREVFPPCSCLEALKGGPPGDVR